jgi:hypothetical protein
VSSLDTTAIETPRPSPVAKLLDAREWAYQTRTIRALDFCFAVKTSDPALGEYLEESFAAMIVDDEPKHMYSLVERDRRARRRFTLFFDGHRTDSFATAAETLHYLLWHINKEAVTGTDRLTIHASAVARERRAVMFVAPMESGKSTIATALVRFGLDYLTDEAVAFDKDGFIEPYPRPIALETGSWPLFADIKRRDTTSVARYVGRQWHLPPGGIRANAVAGRACRAQIIVRLRFDPSAPTRVEPVRRSHMVAWLVENSFNFHMLGTNALERLGAIVTEAECVELTMNDLTDACTTVSALLAEKERA